MTYHGTRLLIGIIAGVLLLTGLGTHAVRADDGKWDWEKAVAKDLPREVKMALGRQGNGTPASIQKGSDGDKDGFRIIWGKGKQTRWVVFGKDGKIIAKGVGEPTDTIAAVKPKADDKPAEKGDSKTVTFAAVKPIIVANCLGCHDKAKHKGGFDLQTSYKTVTETLVKGDVDNSQLYKAVSGDGAKLMPPKNKLSDKDVKTIKDWIAGGAKEK